LTYAAAAVRAGAFLLVLFSATVGRAGEPARARAEFLAGTQAYDQGRFRVAAARFAAGYALEPLPALRFNEAQAWRREFESSGDRVAGQRAVELYRQYLQLPGISDVERGEATVYLRTLDERLRAPVAAAAPPTATTPSPSQLATPPPPRKRTALWVGLGVGAALVVGALAVGLGIGLSAQSSQPPTVRAGW
jgi:hypothetical protein